jgi:hypothetical protein
LITPSSVLLRMRNVSDKCCRENKKYFTFNNFFFENRAVYEMMGKNTVEPGRPQMKTWLMRIACWIPKATNSHLEYVILISFLPLQWSHELAWMLRYTASALLLNFSLPFQGSVFWFFSSLLFKSFNWLLSFHEDNLLTVKTSELSLWQDTTKA